MVINGEKIMGYMLSFSVINQELVRTDDLYLVNKIQNYVQIEFSFDGKEWEDIDKYVIFTTKKKNYSIPLGNKMICNTVASVDALMEMTGEAGKIYLVANNGSGSNAFDEYFWNDSLEVPAFEKFGSIDVDMTDLVTMPQVKNYINSNLSVSLPSTGADAGKLIIELN